MELKINGKALVLFQITSLAEFGGLHVPYQAQLHCKLVRAEAALQLLLLGRCWGVWLKRLTTYVWEITSDEGGWGWKQQVYFFIMMCKDGGEILYNFLLSFSETDWLHCWKVLQVFSGPYSTISFCGIQMHIYFYEDNFSLGFLSQISDGWC